MAIKFPAFKAIDLGNNNNLNALEIIELPLADIIPDQNQPRKNFDEETLNDLAMSIIQYGVIQPIIVKQIDEDKYQIIAGERRWRASAIAGLKKISAIVIHNNELHKNISLSIIENIQREELNPIELAEALYKLSHDHCLSHEAIAKLIGKNRATITNTLRLLNLSAYTKRLLITGKLEMGHARALLTFPPEQQARLADNIIKKNLSVRETERMTQSHKPFLKSKLNTYSEIISKWKEKLTKCLSSKIFVNINENGEGKVIIHFKSPDKIDWLVKQLENDI